MAFIQKNDSIIINTKLTNIGRMLLSSGSLNFSKVELGDSEIDYNYIRDNSDLVSGKDLMVLRPKDLNPVIKTPIKITDNSDLTKTTDFQLISGTELVSNKAKTRGFFSGSSESYTAITNTNYFKYITTTDIINAVGTTNLVLTDTSILNVGDYLLVDWLNPNITATTFNSGSGVIKENRPRPFLWYKVLDINLNDVTVDRNLPNFSGLTSLESTVYVFNSGDTINTYYSTGTTLGYWNENTLAFNSNCNISDDDVLVWNFNNVSNITQAGTLSTYTSKYYNSAKYNGFVDYVRNSTNYNLKNNVGIIHYTNNSISNYYGEGFKQNTFKISLPTIMYHAKTANTMGIEIVSDTVKKVLPTTYTGFTTEYQDLFESTSRNVVGKVFNDLKIAIIEDSEITTALSYKSNRNWTLPNINFASDTATPAEVSANNYFPSKILTLSYLFGNNTDYNPTKNLGFQTPIHSTYLTEIVMTGINSNIKFNFNLSDLKFMSSPSTISAGTGFNANEFKILMNIRDIGDELDPTQWKVFNYTNKLNQFNVWSSKTIDSNSISSQIYRLTYENYLSASTYDIETYLPLPTPSNLSSLGFGEETFLFGNINTDIKAEVFKTSVSISLSTDKYNTSKNPTWIEGDDVYVSEVGIYDTNDNLVMVGKLNNPIKKNNDTFRIILLDLDF